MEEKHYCSICGTALASDTELKGLCPRCLLVLGLGAKPDQRKKIGNYDILGELGRGGMGVVYKAYQVSLNRIVALKILPEQISANKELLMRFKREAKAAAQINHPNVVTIHDIGNDNDIHYIAMEYIKGKSLDEMINEQGQMDVRISFKIIQQVLRALQAAHDLGIIHRDIKPQNIMVQENDRVKVMDFGLAKSLDDAVLKLTAPGYVVGTPLYMSPEQAKGKELDCRSDIFSTGIVLYQMVTGNLPFKGDTPIAVINKIMNESAVAVCSLNSDISKEAAYIINKAMEKNPDDRYSSAKDMENDIEQFLSGTTKTKIIENPLLKTICDIGFSGKTSDKKIKKGIKIPYKIVIFFLFGVIILIAVMLFNDTHTYKKPTQTFNKPTPAIQTATAVVEITPVINTQKTSGFFADVNLEKEIRNFLKKKDNEEIKLEELLTVVDINLSGKNIENLSGIERLKFLEFLTINDNPISDESLKYIGELKRLMSLSLSGCKLITDTGLSHFSENNNTIVYLRLSQTLITDEGLKHIKSFSLLKELYLSYTKITGRGLSVIRNFNQLQVLHLQNCPIKDEAFIPIAEAPALEYLYIPECYEITDAGLATLAKSKSIKILSIENVKRVTEKGIIELSKLKSLESFSMRGEIKIGIEGYKSLRNLKNLKELQIGDSSILDDNRLAAVSEIKSLTMLIIGDYFSQNSPISLSQDSFYILKNMTNLKMLRIPITLFPEDKVKELNKSLTNTTVITDPVDHWDFPYIKQNIPKKT